MIYRALQFFGFVSFCLLVALCVGAARAHAVTWYYTDDPVHIGANASQSFMFACTAWTNHYGQAHQGNGRTYSGPTEISGGCWAQSYVNSGGTTVQGPFNIGGVSIKECAEGEWVKRINGSWQCTTDGFPDATNQNCASGVYDYQTMACQPIDCDVGDPDQYSNNWSDSYQCFNSCAYSCALSVTQRGPNGELGVCWATGQACGDYNNNGVPDGIEPENLDENGCKPGTNWGSFNGYEGCYKTPPSPGPAEPDLDGDGTPDRYDPDIDGDGTPNSTDTDDDNDGIPDSEDTDNNNDGTPDSAPGDGGGWQEGDPDSPATPTPGNCNWQTQDCDGDGNIDDQDGDGRRDNGIANEGGDDLPDSFPEKGAGDCDPTARNYAECVGLARGVGQASASASCDAPPTCTHGDPQMCALLRQSWEAMCAAQGGGDPEFAGLGDPAEAGSAGEAIDAFSDRVAASGIGQMAGGIAGVFSGSGTCPAPEFEAFGETYALDFHCTLYDQIAGILSALMMVVWTIAGIRHVMSA